MKASFVRLFSDSDGESHFDDIHSELNSVEFAPGIPPLFQSSEFRASKVSFFGAPARWKSDWHPSSGRHLFVVLSGTWEVTASDGERRTFSANDVLLVEDTTGKGHSSRVISEEDSIAVLVELPQS